MARKNTQAQAQAQAQAAEPKAPKLTVADLAKMVAALTESVAALTAQVQGAAEPKAPKRKAATKKAAKPKVARPTQEEWVAYRDAHKHEYAGLDKHTRNSVMYKRMMQERKAAAAKA